MSTDRSISPNEQQHHVTKYIFDKLENYAHKSQLWRVFHASHLHRNLLSRSRHISKLHSISEDLVRQHINQLFTDIDQYAIQLNRFLYSQQFDDLPLFLSNRNNNNSAWHTMQIERARQLFPSTQHLSDSDLLEEYREYVREKLTPNHDHADTNGKEQVQKNAFDLDHAYTQAERKGRDYLKYVIQRFRKKRIPDLEIVDEMIKLGKLMQWNFIKYLF